MNAEPLQPLEHDAAFAQEVLGDDSLRDVDEPVRRRVDGILQHRAALGDEHHDMAAGHALHAFDQQLGGNGVDEIGEQDDQRAPLEPRAELGQAEGEIRLLVIIGKLRGRALDPRQARYAAARTDILPNLRVEPVSADQIAALERRPRRAPVRH